MCACVFVFGLVRFFCFLFFVSTSVFQILELFNCFISAFIGVSPPPPHIQIENNISSPLCPVQSSPVVWLLNQSCLLYLVGSSQGFPYGPLRHTRSAEWSSREGVGEINGNKAMRWSEK